MQLSCLPWTWRLPQAWVELEEAITYHAKQLVAWSVGGDLREFAADGARRTRSRIATSRSSRSRGRRGQPPARPRPHQPNAVHARPAGLRLLRRRFQLRDLSPSTSCRSRAAGATRGPTVTACRRATRARQRTPSRRTCRCCTCLTSQPARALHPAQPPHPRRPDGVPAGGVPRSSRLRTEVTTPREPLRNPAAALPGEMRMNARLATKVVVRTTMPRSEAQQAPHFAAARRDGSLRASALSLGLPRHPAWLHLASRIHPATSVATQRGLRGGS